MSDEATDTPRKGNDGGEGPAARLGEGAVEELDERAVDILSWVLDTETRARIYVYLRQQPWSTSEEVAEGTGLYPSTVREALAALSAEGKLHRRKRQSEGAGNNPYEYTAMAPSELIGEVVSQVQHELNALCDLDSLNGDDDEPIHIEVEAVEEE
jgi:predicted transcriptional regulator